MWIICRADDSLEMSSLIFYEKKKKKIKMPCATIVLSTLRVNLGYVSQKGPVSLWWQFCLESAYESARSVQGLFTISAKDAGIFCKQVKTLIRLVKSSQIRAFTFWINVRASLMWRRSYQYQCQSVSHWKANKDTICNQSIGTDQPEKTV